LTTQEAAELLGYDSVESCPAARLNITHSAVDDYIQSATGKDWGKDNPVNATAKLVASILLVRWFEDPGMIGKVNDVGLISLIGQLHAKAITGASV
jgi:hypothetical protein